LSGNPSLLPPRVGSLSAALEPATLRATSSTLPPISGKLETVEEPDTVEALGRADEPAERSQRAENDVTVQLTGVQAMTAIGDLSVSDESVAIPGPRPAAVMPVWHAGRLVVPDEPASADLPEDTLTAVLVVAREDFAQTVAHLQAHPGNTNRSLIEHAARVLDLIPTERPDQTRIFRSGRAVERLAAIVHVDETLGVENKARLADELRHLQQVHEQFPAWRQFRRNARASSLDADQLREVPELLRLVIDTLSRPEAAEFIDATVHDAFQALDGTDDLTFVVPIVGTDLAAFDILESILNLLGQLAEPAQELAVRTMKEQAGAFWKGSLKGTEAIGEHVTLQAWGLFAAFATNAVVGHFPTWFVWAPSLLAMVGKVIDRAVVRGQRDV